MDDHVCQLGFIIITSVFKPLIPSNKLCCVSFLACHMLASALFREYLVGANLTSLGGRQCTLYMIEMKRTPQRRQALDGQVSRANRRVYYGSIADVSRCDGGRETKQDKTR